MDGRGSEGRGLRWRDSLDIGNTDVDDQLQAVRSLSKHLFVVWIGVILMFSRGTLVSSFIILTYLISMDLV